MVELVGEFGQVVVQRDELLVALVQGVDEQRQALGDREEVAPALVEGGDGIRERVQRGVDLFALAGQPVGERFDDVAERPLGLSGRWAQLADDVGDVDRDSF